jgi:hypothetical protein
LGYATFSRNAASFLSSMDTIRYREAPVLIGAFLLLPDAAKLAFQDYGGGPNTAYGLKNTATCSPFAALYAS